MEIAIRMIDQKLSNFDKSSQALNIWCISKLLRCEQYKSNISKSMQSKVKSVSTNIFKWEFENLFVKHKPTELSHKVNIYFAYSTLTNYSLMYIQNQY